MISVIIFLVGGIALALFQINSKHKIIERVRIDNGNAYSGPTYKTVINYPVIFGAILLLLTVMFQPFNIERIDSGSVGLKEHLVGSSRGIQGVELVSGWQIYNTYTERVYEVETDQKTVHYENVSVVVKGGFQCVIKPSFNYKVKADKADRMFVELRQTFKSGGLKGIEDTWLNTAVLGAINDVSNKWQVDSIFNNREFYEQQISREMSRRINAWFEISQIKTNIVPPAALVNSINAKTEAVQNAQASRLQAVAAEAEAQKLVAVAKGQFEAAQYEAKEKELLSQPKLLELYQAETDRIWAQKGVSPYGQNNVFGQGTGILLNR